MEIATWFCNSYPHQVRRTLEVTLKDIEREVYVTLHYKMDGQTGILKRSAEVTNKTHSPLVVEEMQAGSVEPAAVEHILTALI